MNSFHRYLLSYVPDTELISNDQAVNNGAYTLFWLCASSISSGNQSSNMTETLQIGVSKNVVGLLPLSPG